MLDDREFIDIVEEIKSDNSNEEKAASFNRLCVEIVNSLEANQNEKSKTQLNKQFKPNYYVIPRSIHIRKKGSLETFKTCGLICYDPSYILFIHNEKNTVASTDPLQEESAAASVQTASLQSSSVK